MLACLALLSGCLLTSGEQSLADAQATAGNFSTSFVSAEGVEERVAETGLGATELSVIAIVEVEQGELRVELLNPTGAVALSVQGRPDEQITRSGSVRTDEQGQLRYRLVTRGARNGAIRVLYNLPGH